MQKFIVKDFSRESFPALYRCADDASTAGQKWYLRWLTINLALLVVAAVVGSINFYDLNNKRLANGVTTLLFVAATGVTLLLAYRRWERIWYAGRAVAESAKSLTWKFVCGAPPFTLQLDSKEAVVQFTNALQELLRENKHLAAAFAGSTQEQVTDFMLVVRESATGVKRDIYLSQRVSEQQAWYANMSETNRKHRNIWFTLLVIFQVTAALASATLTVHPSFPWRATAVFSTLASAAVAWGQMKRYQELAQAYGLAAQELSFIAARGAFINSHEELERFVNDAETAISREHAMWVARRETI